jgi:hypothetical protein
MPVAVAARLLGSATGGAGAGRGRRSCAATASWLPGRAGRPGHPRAGGRSQLRATYEDLDAAFWAVRAGAELVATQVNRIARPRRLRASRHGRVGCGCWSTPPASRPGCWASRRRAVLRLPAAGLSARSAEVGPTALPGHPRRAVSLLSSPDGGALLRVIAGEVAGHQGPGIT